MASLDTTHPDFSAGYHIAEIKRGELGKLSKIREELEEVEDAARQGIAIMVLLELSDLIGAVEAYLEREFPHQNLQDLIDMSEVTKRAFLNGKRK